jgi:hypothetical protein
MLRSVAIGCALSVSLPGAAFAQAPPPGWYVLKSGTNAMAYAREASASDLLLEFDLGASIAPTERAAREFVTQLTAKRECGAFGDVAPDAAGGAAFRAETRPGARPACAVILAARGRGETVVIVAKTIAPAGRLDAPRAGAEQLLAMRTGRPLTPPATRAETEASARSRDAGASTSDAALSAALAAVPAANVPVHVVLHGEGSYSGWPPSYRYIVSTHLYFANGYMTRCADWDPGLLSPTPESLGRADPACGISRWRTTGTTVEVQASDGSWSTVEVADATMRRFGPAERLDVRFGNVGGAGFGGPGAAVSVNTISGSDLRMTRDGEIAVGAWSTTVLSGANVGGGSSGRSQPLVGRYRLDGHLIAITRPDGSITRGFIVGVNEQGVLGHVYLNGKHFWNRDN